MSTGGARNRTRRAARWTTALATTAAAVLAVVVLAPAERADAASMWVAHQGTSISSAPVPAAPVELTAIASSPLTSVTFSVGGQQLARTTRIVSGGGTWRATATVDLTGRSGSTVLRTRFTNGAISSTVDKTLRAVPVPVPVAAPVAAPAPAPAVSVPAPPVAAGPDTTGVPAGVTLTPQVGDLFITRPGTVVDGVDLTGCITVRADDVVIRNSRVTCTASATNMVVSTNGSYRNLLVTDSELDGGGVVDIGIGWQNYTLRRSEVRGTNDGARAGSNTVVEGSWIHALVRKGALHPDCVQSTGGTGIRISGNTLDPRNAATGDQGNAAIMLGSELRPFVLTDVLVQGNRLSSGNYTVNVRGDAAVSGVALRGNTFTTDAKYGPVLAPAAVEVTDDNVLDGTGTPITVVRTP